jgi:DNA-binding NtrC family response regulator
MSSSATSLRRGSPDPSRPNLNGRHFLIVDDEPHMLEVIADILRHFGATNVERAGGVEAALAKCGPNGFDCIISDFNMKPENGLQFLQSIRQGKRSRLPRDQRFVLITGHGEIEVVKSAKQLDVSAYLVKPVAMDMIIKTLARVFAQEIALKPPEAYAGVIVTGMQ